MAWLRTPSLMVAGIAQLCLLALLIDQPAARAAESSYAVVKEGAFLLSKSANVPRGTRNFYSLVGYLPIGTIVEVGEGTQIGNRDTREYENYVWVNSELGLAGHIREDLLVPIGDTPIAVPIGPDKLEFWLGNSTPKAKANCDDDDRKDCIFFSRNDDVHLEILSNPDELKIKARLIRHNADSVKKYRKIEEGSIHGGLLEFDYIKIIDPDKIPTMPRWVPNDPRENGTFDKMIAEFKEDVASKTKLNALLFDNLQCILSASGDAELAFKFFGNGLGFRFDVALKNRDTKYILETYTLKKGDTETVFTLLRSVRCSGTQPERMEQLVLQEGAHNPKKREYLRLKDIEAATSKWVTSLQSEEKPTKMIVIKQWENYNKTFEMFDSMASGYISRLPDVEKRTLLNFLIQQISVYQQPNYQASK